MANNFNDSQNKDLVNTIIDRLKMNPVTDNIPRSVIPTIQPVFEIDQKKCTFARNGRASNATSTTIMTTSSSMDTYLCGGSVSVAKDVSSTSTATNLLVTLADGTAASIVEIVGITLTAQENCITTNFNPPLKLARNTIVAITNTTATANILAGGTIWGYTEEAGNNLSV